MKGIFVVFCFMVFGTGFNAQSLTPKNTIMLESNVIATAHLSYDRIVASFSEKTALMIGGDYVLGVGFGHGSHWIIPEANLKIFGPKHFLETGLQYAIGISDGDVDPEDEEELDSQSPGLRLAYRYQAARGFTLRLTVNSFFLFDPPILPNIGSWLFVLINMHLNYYLRRICQLL